MPNKIRETINFKNLKISDVLLKTGLAKSYFYDVMNGKSIPSLANARKIADAVGTSLDELFPEEPSEGKKH